MVPFRLEWGPIEPDRRTLSKRNYLLAMPASLLTGMYQEWKVVQYDGIEVVQRENKSSKCHTRQISLARTAGCNRSRTRVSLLYNPIHFIAVTSAKDPANNEKYSLSNPFSTNLELSSRRGWGVMYWAYFKLPRCSLIHSCCLRANTTKDFTRTQTSLAVRKNSHAFFWREGGSVV